jgi:hypothetical protein
MPIPTTHQQERLSLAYVQAVVASAGAQLIEPTGHEYGIDAHIQGIRRMADGSFNTTGFMVMLQVKATMTSELRDDVVVYDMKAKAYNKLAAMEGPTECVLVLCCLPSDEEQWCVIDEEQLTLRRCSYWTRIPRGAIPANSQKRIFIPRTQIFTPDAVRFLLTKTGMINP